MSPKDKRRSTSKAKGKAMSKSKGKGKGKGKDKATSKSKGKATAARAGRQPKKKCCVSKPRCSRCPLRMLADGTLPDGYTVRKRRLVKVKDGPPSPRGKGPQAA